MTALNLATDIPSSINTVERLHDWSGQLLYKMYGAQSIQEVNNGVMVPCVIMNQGRTGTGVIARITRTILFLRDDYATNTEKEWMNIVNYPFNSDLIPPAYKTN